MPIFLEIIEKAQRIFYTIRIFSRFISKKFSITLFVFFLYIFLNSISYADCNTIEIYQPDGTHTLENMPADTPHTSIFLQNSEGKSTSTTVKSWGFNEIISLSGTDITKCISNCLEPAMFSIEYGIKDKKYITDMGLSISLMEYYYKKQLDSINSQKEYDSTYIFDSDPNENIVNIYITEKSGITYKYNIIKGINHGPDEELKYFYICKSGSMIKNETCKIYFNIEGYEPAIGKLTGVSPKIISNRQDLYEISTSYAKTLLDKSKCEAGAKL